MNLPTHLHVLWFHKIFLSTVLSQTWLFGFESHTHLASHFLVCVYSQLSSLNPGLSTSAKMSLFSCHLMHCWFHSHDWLKKVITWWQISSSCDKWISAAREVALISPFESLLSFAVSGKIQDTVHVCNREKFDRCKIWRKYG